MRQGLFPGQQDALVELARKGLRAKASQRRQRRAFLGLLVAGAATTSAAYWLGTRRNANSTGAEGAPTAEVAWMHRLAQGPLADLEAAAPNLTATIELHGGDELLWLGYERLVLLALASGDRRALARDLLVLATVKEPPPYVRSLIERLRESYR